MHRYYLEFTLIAKSIPIDNLRNSIIEFGRDLEISQGEGEFNIRIDTEDPTIIFDTCAQFGRIKSVKVEERPV